MGNKEFPIAMGTASGTFLSSFAALQVEDILTSALLAVIGAVISFIMSFLLNFFVKPRLRKLKSQNQDSKKTNKIK